MQQKYFSFIESIHRKYYQSIISFSTVLKSDLQKQICNLLFSHSCYWSMFWIQKIPTQRTTFGLPNNSNFPLFICCGPEFRTKLWPQGGRVPSVTRYFFALSYHEIFFQQFKQNIFLSKHVKCVVLIYRGFCRLCLPSVCVGGECQKCRITRYLNRKWRKTPLTKCGAGFLILWLYIFWRIRPVTECWYL